jgi:ParB-like chromosome segregation protein Spo0J
MGNIPERTAPLAGAIRRRPEHRETLLGRAGPLLSGVEVARLLGLDAAEVEALRGAQGLLAVQIDTGWTYPACQFVGAAVLPGLADLLQAHARKDTWAILDLLLAPDPALSGRSPIQALQDGDERALKRHVAQTGGDGFA